MVEIGYTDHVVLYTRHTDGVMETETWYGTVLDDVRLELTQGANMRASGMENADACTLKVMDASLPKRYVPPQIWDNLDDRTSALTFDPKNGTFFVVTRKDDLGILADVPAGMVNGTDYPNGWFEHLKNSCGYVYRVRTADHYSLIPHWEIGGI